MCNEKAFSKIGIVLHDSEKQHFELCIHGVYVVFTIFKQLPRPVLSFLLSWKLPTLSPFCYYCSILVPGISSLDSWPLLEDFSIYFPSINEKCSSKTFLQFHTTDEDIFHATNLILAFLWPYTSYTNFPAYRLVTRLCKQACTNPLFFLPQLLPTVHEGLHAQVCRPHTLQVQSHSITSSHVLHTAGFRLPLFLELFSEESWFHSLEWTMMGVGRARGEVRAAGSVTFGKDLIWLPHFMVRAYKAGGPDWSPWSLET